MMQINRRDVLKGGLVSATALGMLKISFAYAPGEARLIVVLLRGGLDGLAAFPPYGDPEYRNHRGDLALPVGGREGARKLDGLFAMHPALADLFPLWQSGEMAVVHAAATPYRKRSHFDAQQLLESGGNKVHEWRDGWLNRAVNGVAFPAGGALAVGESMPLILSGNTRVSSWAPARLPDAGEDFFRRVELLLADDPILGAALMKGLQTRNLLEDADMAGERRGNSYLKTGSSVAALLKAANGPRIANIELPGWDTHVAQGTVGGRLHNRLLQLPKLVLSLRDRMGTAWDSTTMVVVTEFGRTVRPNGSRGTDHGTAAAGFLCGGAVRGGRIITDWPGLRPDQLHEGRDLKPTMDIRSVFAGLLVEHMGLSEGYLFDYVFPGGHRLRPMYGLVNI